MLPAPHGRRVVKVPLVGRPSSSSQGETSSLERMDQGRELSSYGKSAFPAPAGEAPAAAGPPPTGSTGSRGAPSLCRASTHPAHGGPAPPPPTGSGSGIA